MIWDSHEDGWLLALSPLIFSVFGDKSAEIMKTSLKESIPFPVLLDDCDCLMHPDGIFKSLLFLSLFLLFFYNFLFLFSLLIILLKLFILNLLFTSLLSYLI